MEYLESLQLAFPDLAAEVSVLGDCYGKSLWHELTQKLLEFVKYAQLQLDDTLYQLFEQFIKPILAKLNPLAVAKLGVACCKTQKDVSKARTFLQHVGDSVKPSNQQAYTICRAEDALLALKGGAVKEAGTMLEECEEFVKKHEAEDIEPVVHSTYYSCYAAYLKATKQYDDYYHTALLALVYSDIEKMPIDEQQSWAYDIGIAALLGEKVYNFGELLGNPVINSLDATNLQWVRELLRAYNKGDLQGYEQIAQQYGDKMGQVPELLEKAAFLKQKIQLMALLNFLFNLTASNTVVSFTLVAKHTSIEVNQVEYLLMKALALGIIKGVIDQVAQQVSVTWVQARVLDREEIKALAAKVSAWSDTVRTTLDLVNATGAQLAHQQ
jgi:26S proteasome regulatory subunit N9|eukprot:CAMPEP_0174304732 /NCGR_PEP_ID=MMETSP0809-20121228/60962_1 /TAXON_ID=73025 ORGANISM="Eutreptiella gymnastica-like, Strain CCMP1594" /NCGR_SAMPLE_ID=MMETSP0809 /ASSEMBLY_ACC=CAM_ASM_000658 /LENGTH=382 /DNA_ID=CAMNT_0015411019 /DNA_START=14 /DNA_END=1162 /DNA_ORIENTATION=-